MSAFEISSDISNAEKQTVQEDFQKNLGVLGKAIKELSSLYALISDNKSKIIEKAIRKLDNE